MSRASRAGAWLLPMALASVPLAGAGQAPAASAASEAAHAIPRVGFDLPERDLQGLLDEKANTEWLVRQLKGDPDVVVIQFPSLQAQGLALNRTAALVEKSGGSRSHVMSDAELDALIRRNGDTPATFYLGHDYTAIDLARFFDAAGEQQVPLNAEEQGLRSLLLQIGMLVRNGQDGLAPSRVAALVTFGAPQRGDPEVPADQEMDPARRASVLGHELSHGVYFTRAAYRDYCHRFWTEQLSGSERATWRRYLKGLGYDGTNEDLLVNEMQALLMHTSDRRDFDAAALGVSDGEFEGMRNRFVLHAGEAGPRSVTRP